MTRSILVCIFLICYKITVAQNLIPNYSFELFSHPPQKEAETHLLDSWETITGKSNDLHFALPDFLHTEGKNSADVGKAYFGKLQPFHGKGMIGLVAYNQLIPNFREYLSVPLNSPMDTSKTYRLVVHIANGSKSYGKLGTYFGFYFSKSQPNQSGHSALTAAPQLETSDVIFSEKWQKHFFMFKPSKPYKYLTVGNFRSDEAARPKKFAEDGNVCAYYLIDAISLEPIQPVAKQKRISMEDSLKNVASEILQSISAEQLENRPVVKQQVIEIESRVLEVKIWDDREVDGDQVSLNLNGEWVVENYTLSKKKLQLKLQLKQGGDNFLIMFAPSLGNKPPNTAAISYRDKNGKVKKLFLKSDLTSCGAIQIICKS